MGDMMKNVLEIKNVSKKISKRQILKDISLEVKEGEIFGFVGPNGAGKTTLIKVMLGLYKMDSGNVKIAGYDIKKDFEKAMEEIGAIIENPEMYGYLSGKDNLAIYARMEEGVSDSFQRELIRMVKLGGRINNKVKTRIKRKIKYLSVYDKDKLIERRNEILEKLKNPNLDKNEINSLENELSQIIIKLAKQK